MTRLAVTESVKNRRALERAPTTLRAKVFPGALDCVIRDYTKRGARLEFQGPAPLEDQLVVVIWASGLTYEAEPRWRKGSSMGVLFTGSRDLRRPAPPHLAEVAALWRARRPRITRRKLMRTSDAIGGWESKTPED
jgi:hypothetical protein